MHSETPANNVWLTRPQRVDKAVHTLEGILKGIAIDGVINPEELKELTRWAKDHGALLNRHPFSELLPRVNEALKDGVIDTEEQEDILWLCRNLSAESNYYDGITSDIQRLQGILHGILADGVITDEEVLQLRDWIHENDHLKGSYPYSEIDSLLTHVLQDGVVSDGERESLALFFEDFVSYSLSRRIRDARTAVSKPKPPKLSGICVSCPELVFEGRAYCFTGESAKAARSEIEALVLRLGGRFSKAISRRVHYLVIGAEGNPAWTYSCYGRKVEQAMKLRADGHGILLIHEHDFWDATHDLGHAAG